MALSLFAKKQPVSEPIEDRGGKYILRQSISLRVKKHENLQTLALTLNVPPDGIIAFSNGADNLNEAQLSAVATSCLATPHTRLILIASSRPTSQQRTWACPLRLTLPPSRLGRASIPRPSRRVLRLRLHRLRLG